MQDTKKDLFYGDEQVFEIVEFSIGETVYGINVGKVREVINLLPLTSVPKSHPYIEGVFTLRGRVLPLINLANVLQIKNNDPKIIIIAELNDYQVGFLVDEVFKIQRVSWEQLEPAPEITKSNLIIGIIKVKGNVIILLDFENIIYSINSQFNKQLINFEPTIKEEELKKRQEKTIMIVDDSPFLLDLVVNSLNKVGYHNIIALNNGKEALDYLEKIKLGHDNIFDVVQILITDIEMPTVDGKTLLKCIREDKKLKDLPVIIFSSLLNGDEVKKVEDFGATAQIDKPKIEELILTVNKYIK